MSDVTVIFEVKAQTVVGEEICVVGGHDRLGNWDPKNAPKLIATPESYPHWSIVIPFSHGTILEYKYIIRNTNTNDVRWETFAANRRIEVKSPWLLAYDGKFGKRPEHSYLATPSSFVSLRKEAKKPVPSTPNRRQRFQNIEIIQQIEELKEALQEKDQIIEQLQSNAAVFECEDLEQMESEDLKELARKAKKTLQRTNHVLMERLEKETKKLIASNMCALCPSKIDTVLLPCGHVCVCHVCVSKIRGKCLTCYTPIESVHRVYIK